MLDQALDRFPGQVQAVESRIAALEARDDAQRLRIVVEAAVALHQRIELALAGMAERGVAEVMGKRQRFRQILVEARVRAMARLICATSMEWVSLVR